MESGTGLPCDKVLAAVKARLAATFGPRFKGLVLYGSEARGEAAPDSDIDLLVLLEGPVRLGRDLRRIIECTYDVQLEVFRPIHAHPVDVKVYEAAEFGLYRNVRAEGIAV